jgi:ribosome-associated toxin RatA of RatAB toxin-antitoxin module
VHPSIRADDAYAALQDLERHVVVTEVVRSVRVEPTGENEQISHWDVQYRRGLLRWSQFDVYDVPRRRVTFSLRDGDPAELEGFWQVREAGDGCSVTFSCDFDLGIPGLGASLDPLAARILRETIERQLLDVWQGIELQPSG